MRATLLSYVLFVTLFAQIQALYYIDDTDKRITYASTTAGKGYSKNWRHLNQEKDNLLAVGIDEKMCFGGTATYTQNFSSNDLTMEVPFKGTGIVLYVAQDVGDVYNTSISLDGGVRTNHFAYSPPHSTASRYNISLYEIQNLSDGDHTVNVALEPGISRLLFDYAAVTGDASNWADRKTVHSGAILFGISSIIWALIMS